MNGQLPGPLLDDGPNLTDCGWQCPKQNFHSDDDEQVGKLVRWDSTPNDDDISSTEMTIFNMTKSLAHNIPPLLNMALALFSVGSYLDINHTATQAYHLDHVSYRHECGGCIGVVPFIKLLHNPDDDRDVSPTLEPCISGLDTKSDLLIIVAAYMYLFVPNPNPESNNILRSRDDTPHIHTNNLTAERIQDAFVAAACLATDVWSQLKLYMAKDEMSSLPSWDMGVDQQVPEVSRAGVILISILLGLYLTSLLALLVYSAWTLP